MTIAQGFVTIGFSFLATVPLSMWVHTKRQNQEDGALFCFCSLMVHLLAAIVHLFAHVPMP